VPIHMGNGYTLGDAVGEEVHTLNQAELPEHTHSATVVNANADVLAPANNFLGASSNLYHAGPANVSLARNTVSSVGGGQPHENRQPFLVMNFCIALQGATPPQS